MSVPEGFKQTEVGVIPEDWNVSPLEKVSLYIGSGTSITINENGVFPIYGSTGIIGYRKKYDYSGEIILVARVGANAGMVNKVNGKYCVSDNTLLVRLNNFISFDYISYFLDSIKLNRMVFGSGQPLITGGQLKKIKIPLPPTRAEQAAIAAALSDMDALIEGVEKLLEKKRRIKQGAMQELLRPKEGWAVKALGDLCSPSKKRIDPKTSQQIYKCVELEHIGQESGRLLGYAFTDELKSQKTLFNSGDTLFGKLRPYLKKFLFADFDGCCTTEIWVLQPTSYIHRKLLFYIIQTDIVLEAANQSEGTKMPRSDWKKVKEVNISIPPRQEQKEIAAILSDMDSEIEQLEKQVAKYRQLKTGMMQELLTGKKRLI